MAALPASPARYSPTRDSNVARIDGESENRGRGAPRSRSNRPGLAVGDLDTTASHDDTQFFGGACAKHAQGAPVSSPREKAIEVR